VIAAVGEGGAARAWFGTRGGRRVLNGLGVAAVVGLMAYALYQEHVVGLDACPLCIFQRGAMIALGLVFLAAALHAPRGVGARAYAGLGALVALTGIGIAGWHVRMQNLPPDAVPSCGPGLDVYFEVLPVFEALRAVFTASGECSEVNWSFLGLSMPAWVLIWFVLLGGLVVAANWARLPR
jgi:disulfide bond formation protein DsbB